MVFLVGSLDTKMRVILYIIAEKEKKVKRDRAYIEGLHLSMQK
jgi:hypothetical protein